MRLTKAQRIAVKAVDKWCVRQGLSLTSRPRHIFPAAYVVGYAAPLCIVVAVPFTDSEPQCADFDRSNPLKTIRRFDPSLKAGDWCCCAYVCTEKGNELVAVQVPSEAVQ